MAETPPCKTCIVCGEEKPQTADYFERYCSRGIWYWHSYCLDCHRAHMRQRIRERRRQNRLAVRMVITNSGIDLYRYGQHAAHFTVVDDAMTALARIAAGVGMYANLEDDT